MSIEDDIKDGISIPDEVKKAIGDLNSNLIHGPTVGSFTDSTQNIVKEWFYDLPSYYWDRDAGLISTSSEDDTLPEIDTKTLARCLLGEFAPYI